MNYQKLHKPPLTKMLKSGRVTLRPGESVGEHRTEKREEIIVVLKGTAAITEGSKTFQVREGGTHFIKENILHNVKNNAKETLEYVYVAGLLG